MRRKTMLSLAALLVAVGVVMAPGGATAHEVPTHVMYVNGISTITGSCEYQWKQVTGTNPLNPTQSNPVRDELGIPQPVSLGVSGPPCRTGSTSCALSRNLGPYKPSWRAADPTQGEVGVNPPCAGTLSAADLPGAQGCVDAVTGGACNLNAPTWFYGYCGQTYGGAAGGTITTGNGEVWSIVRMGFTRGRGIWEFGGRVTRAGKTGYIRLYLAAAPDKPGEAAACDITKNLSSVLFSGVIILTEAPTPGALPAKIFRTKPGWHFCTQDMPFTGIEDGC